MKCTYCDGETITKRVRKQQWLNGKLYIIENVKAEVCPECGERYYHAAVLDTIDSMIAGDHTVKEVLAVEVLTA
ncbi:MAG: YgiT-type zinc finger protein [Candidatus Hydrogenedentes bacterium]|nr:YgiT-type zinc finger protein [Candidatus Hydrogenedentota bacterium]